MLSVPLTSKKENVKRDSNSEYVKGFIVREAENMADKCCSILRMAVLVKPKGSFE